MITYHWRSRPHIKGNNWLESSLIDSDVRPCKGMELMSQYCRTLLFHFIFSFHSSSLPDAFFFFLVFFQTTSSFILLLFTPFSFFFLFIICPFPLPSICLLILLNLILRLLSSSLQSPHYYVAREQSAMFS